ncbi:hypothetical protein PIB30_091004 [Stylosanthes scabra]|uniref:Uncharacterized protein n=1 Tax=Stylosanthes scabra TaxID=79078 RepID=A0ABU6XS29_9FABA|nr:hypothetical protein [Stylosanthes scabra]
MMLMHHQVSVLSDLGRVRPVGSTKSCSPVDSGYKRDIPAKGSRNRFEWGSSPKALNDHLFLSQQCNLFWVMGSSPLILATGKVMTLHGNVQECTDVLDGVRVALTWTDVMTVVAEKPYLGFIPSSHQAREAN